MTVTRRIFVSMPVDLEKPKPNPRDDLKWRIVEKIEQLRYRPEIFTNPRGMPGLASNKVWSRQEADKVMRKCIGAAIIGLPRWVIPNSGGDLKLPTEFNHYEGAVAYTLGLPMLVVVQADVERRVVFDQSYGVYMSIIPPDKVNSTWLEEKEFQVVFDYWASELSERRDVFLGIPAVRRGLRII